MARLDGKVALITGAARGMGASHAKTFIEEGAAVVLTDVDTEAGAALAKRLGPRALFLAHDVTSHDQWVDVVTEGEHAFGPITVLVNNAGMAGPSVMTAEIDAAIYRRICAINQDGVFLGMKTVLPSMLRGGGGSIVNISSIAGITAVPGFHNLAYVGSKFAVRGMTKATAIEYATQNIRVNSVHPGYIRTPLMDETIKKASEEEIARMMSVIPMGRVGEADEASQLVLFLASDESSYVTGSEHVIDGGIVSQ